MAVTFTELLAEVTKKIVFFVIIHKMEARLLISFPLPKEAKVYI